MGEMEFGVLPGDGIEIIDFQRRGNVVRFFLGHNGDQWGDDWNDYPYEYNAGEVSDQYVSAIVDVAFPFQYYVIEPADGCDDSHYCKKDFIDRYAPCLVVCVQDMAMWGADYSRVVAFSEKVGEVARIYFGDKIDDVLRKIPSAVILD